MAQSIASEVTSEQEKQFVCFFADAAESAAKTAVAQVKSSPCVSAGTPTAAGGSSSTGGSTGLATGLLAARFSAPATRRSDPSVYFSKKPLELMEHQGFLICHRISDFFLKGT